MRNLTKHIQRTILCVAVVAIAGLYGCNKTSLVAPSSSDAVFVIEWPSTKTSTLPKTGAIYLYPTLGGDPIIIPNVEGRSSQINLSEGTYNLIIHNENINSIQLRNKESFNDFEAFLPIKPLQTLSHIKASVAKSITTVVDQADYLYLLSGTAFRQIEIVKGESKTFTLSPKPVTQSFRFEVVINTNIAFSQVNGLLSGVASRLNVRTTKAIPTDISAIEIPFGMDVVSQKLVVKGIVETFGVDPENRNPGSNTLVLDLIPVEPNEEINTHYEEDLTVKFDQYNNINLDVKVVVDPPNPDKPKELQISVEVKPWIQQDGGIIEVNPNLPKSVRLK